jgi:hypothetical protein
MAGVSATGNFHPSGGQRLQAGTWWKPWTRRSAKGAAVSVRAPSHVEPMPALPTYGAPVVHTTGPATEELPSPLDLEQAQFLARLRQAGL